MHGREEEAEREIKRIEAMTEASGGQLEPVDESKAIEVKPTNDIGFLALLRVLFTQYPSRAFLGASLMITQSFLYNSIFFTYTLPREGLWRQREVGAVVSPRFCSGQPARPAHDRPAVRHDRARVMISSTYIISGVLLGVSAFMFRAGYLTATTQAIWWSVVFFFASAGASAAYLTVSETFPLEVRAKAIAVFFAIAQCFGSLGTHLYGHLVGNGQDHNRLFLGYLLGAAVMVVGGIVEIFLGVNAEGRSLEDIATPLSAVRRIPEFGSGYGAPRRG